MGGFVGLQSFLQGFGELKSVLGGHDNEELFHGCKFSGSDLVNEREIELDIDLAGFDGGVVDVDDGSCGIRGSFDLASIRGGGRSCELSAGHGHFMVRESRPAGCTLLYVLEICSQ